MNIRKQLNFILQGQSPSAQKPMVFSRQLIRKKSKVLPVRASSPIQEMFSARLKPFKSMNSPKCFDSSYLPTERKSQRKSMFQNSKESLKAIKELQDLCNQARMIHISSQISMGDKSHRSVNISEGFDADSSKDLAFRGKIFTKNLINPRLLDLSKKRRNSYVRPSAKSNLQRSSSRNSQLSTKQSHNLNQELPLPDLKIMNSFKLSKEKEIGVGSRKKRYQLIHI